MDLALSTVRNALNCKLFNDLIRLTSEFRSQSDWAKFGLLLAQYVSVMRTISNSLYERLDPDEQTEFGKWFLLRWAQIDVLGQQEKDEYERKWDSTKRYNWSVRSIGGKKHVIVDLRDIYGFQLVYDGTYKTIDEGAWILCDFLHNQYCFKNFSVKEGDVILDAGAYIGDTALRLSHATHGNCTIHSFEISPPNYDTLRKNIAYNKLANIYANRLAVYSSRRTGKIRFQIFLIFARLIICAFFGIFQFFDSSQRLILACIVLLKGLKGNVQFGCGDG